MRILKSALALSAFVTLAACGSEETKAPSAEMALLADLQTELAMERADSQKVVSALELGKTAEPEVKEAPVAAPQAAAPRQSTARRSTSSTAARSSSGSSSSGSVASAPARQPRVVEVKNTKRDAVIGAAAGAAIGAVAGGSNNRVQGAIIGAAAGGIAGAVIGSTIDKSTRVEY